MRRLSLIGLRTGTILPISESDIQQVAAKENWVDMASFNMQLHGDLVS